MSQEISFGEEFVFEGKVAIVQVDLEDKIIFANRKFCEVTGYSIESLLGKNQKIIFHPDIPNSIVDKMHDALNGGQTWTGVLKCIRADHRYYWVDIEIMPTHDNRGRKTGYISVSKASARKNINENEKIYHKLNTTI